MSEQIQRTSLWAGTAFYSLVALEFLYMASPFAAFFYSIYTPILDFISRYESLAWLNRTFLPHIVQDTTSPLLNIREETALVLMVIGIAGFIAAAVPVYYGKIFRKRMVTGGLYSFIRHPQYLFLAVWGMGLTIIWPRMIVLLSYVTMLFIYYLLARLEEKECLGTFGESYGAYLRRTPMFIPFLKSDRMVFRSSFAMKRFRYGVAVLYPAALLIAASGALLLGKWSIAHLYSLTDGNALFVSVTKISREKLSEVVRCTLENTEVKKRIGFAAGGPGARWIDYILPAKMYMMEIPMNEMSGEEGYHFIPHNDRESLYRIVFTRAETGKTMEPGLAGLLTPTIRRIPELEVVVDLQKDSVVKISPPRGGGVVSNELLPVY